MNEDQNGDSTEIMGRYSALGHQDHAKGFSKALQDALEQAQERGLIRVGGSYDSEVRFSISIEVTNPPWVGDYRVWLNPQPRP